MAEKSVQVGVVLGSDSDMDTIEPGLKLLKELELDFEIRILSAHRTPDELAEYSKTAAKRGLKVIIAVAGMSAALPGAVAAHTQLPVIGVPVSSGALAGIDALLAISQMPPGVPVATMSIGKAGAKNAAILSARILGLSDKKLDVKLGQFNEDQREKVLAKDKKIK